MLWMLQKPGRLPLKTVSDSFQLRQLRDARSKGRITTHIPDNVEEIEKWRLPTDRHTPCNIAAQFYPSPEKIRGEGFADLYKKLNFAYPNEEKRSLSDGHKMELSVKWEIPQAMNTMLFNFDHYRKRDWCSGSYLWKLSQGNRERSTACCPSRVGFKIIVWHQPARAGSAPSFGKTWIEKPNVITASGTSDALVNVACALTWFCCAIRPDLTESFILYLSLLLPCYYVQTNLAPMSPCGWSFYNSRWESRRVAGMAYLRRLLLF